MTTALLLLGAGPLTGTAAERGPQTRASLSTSASTSSEEAQVIVKFKTTSKSVLSATSSSAASADRVVLKQAATLGARTGLALRDGVMAGPRLQVLHASGMTSAALAAQLAADSDVEYAVPNGRKQVHAAPSDPYYAGSSSLSPSAGQWYLRTANSTFVAAVNAEAAWAKSSGSADVVVAVLDTGVRFKHPDLVGKLLPGYDFVSDTTISNDGDGRDADPSDPGDWVTSAENSSGPSKLRGCGVNDSSWHGTQTAGLIAAATNNGIGIAGIGRHVRVLPVRVLGKCSGDDSDIIAAMYWAAGISVPGVPDNPTPAKVISMSLGSSGSCGAYQDAVTAIRAAGVVIVASAGNDGLTVNSPANCTGVIAVGGLRHIGTKGGYSSLGSAVTISAPAGNCVNQTGDCLYPITSTSNTGTTTPSCPTYTSSGSDAAVGTSFSAPLVAGTLALMRSANPSLTPDELTSLLRSSARAFPTSGAGNAVTTCQTPGSTTQEECYCTTSTCGAGMLDAGAAVSAAASGRTVANLQEGSALILKNASTLLSATNSQAATGQTLSGYAWSLSDASLATLNGTVTASTASLTATASGEELLQLLVTDSAGGTSSARAVIHTGTAPDASCETGSSTSSSSATTSDSSSGGGAVTPVEVGLGLLAFVALGASRRRRAR